jgi:hypothetical protein
LQDPKPVVKKTSENEQAVIDCLEKEEHDTISNRTFYFKCITYCEWLKRAM